MVKIADLFGQGENFLSSVRFFGCVCGLWLLIVIFFKRALVDVRWLFWNSVFVFVDVLVACSLDIWLVLCFVDLCLFVCSLDTCHPFLRESELGLIIGNWI